MGHAGPAIQTASVATLLSLRMKESRSWGGEGGASLCVAWLLWPPTQPPPSLRPQHYHHHKSVSVGGPPGLVPLGAEGVSSPWSAPRLKPPPPSSTARARLTPAPRAYLAPRDFRERNLQLIRSVRGLLASDEARFSEFRSRSGEFRQVRRAGGWGPAQPPGPRPGRA